MTTLSVVYAPERAVTVKATPTTTLQSVIAMACEKIPNAAHPESYLLVYNNKTLDLSLPVRFANLPQGAKLTLKLAPPSLRNRGASAPASQGLGAGNVSGGAAASAQKIKVALQIVGSVRIINDFLPTTTLWDIVATAEAGSNGQLNLTAKYREDRAEDPGRGSNSPAESMKRAVFGSMQNVYATITGSNPSSRTASPSPPTRTSPQPAPMRIYQQPVLLLPHKEISTIEEMQSTTLRSLGFTKGNLMIRLSFRDAPMPAVVPPKPVVENQAKVQSASTVFHKESSAPTLSTPITPKPTAPTTTEAAQAVCPIDKHADNKQTDGHLVSAAKLADSTTAIDLGNAPSIQLLSQRQVRVFNAPSSPSAPLSSRFVLPDSFYQITSNDTAMLVRIQKARMAESERGFKSRSAQEAEEAQRHEQFKKKHPKTAVRFRFPDLTQIQATFLSAETVSELFVFIEAILRLPQALRTLVLQPPLQDLVDMKNKTLFDAKMTPAVVVHVRFQSDIPKTVNTMALLCSEVSALAEVLDPAAESPMAADSNDGRAATPTTSNHASLLASSARDPASSTNRGNSSSSPGYTQKTSSSSSQQSKDNAATAQGARMPKWFLAGQKR
ncbi:hypothetical protein GGI25_004548 [Coemansia spiralis]|uniref:UBX domain-containing protein n=2 Tax=Coemansia TaxID=4863 RepID=A0A9W8G4K0_9FUNG|nr:hypothetical protein EDC05_004382 [Coemansia umbellata]KAJ2620662.1 hypothetical protein GGI26_004824 [Coemansia sp. RSA 1358]KAJ2673801.1 hypothetical protein GGI25_004548 [Coemansia spiralis]